MDNSSSSKPNYLIRHWRGDLSLAKTYWLNATLSILILGRSIGYIPTAYQASEPSVRALATVIIMAAITILLLWIWGIVGIWRSANKHVSRGGKAGWAIAAKAMCILGAMSVIGQFSAQQSNIIDQFQLMIGIDGASDQPEISVEGSTLKIGGSIAVGSESTVQDLLNANPSITTVALSTNGGRLMEAHRIAQIIKTKGLDTMVSGNCAGACPVIFLAGKNRLLDANGRIGFNSPYSLSDPDGHEELGRTQMHAAFEEAGLPEELVKRIFDRSSSDTLALEIEEMVEAKIVTGFTKAFVIEDFQLTAKDINSQQPQEVDEITALVSANADELKLTYNYRINMPANSANVANASASFRPTVVSEYCGNKVLRLLVAAGGAVTFKYADPEGQTIAEVLIDQC